MLNTHSMKLRSTYVRLQSHVRMYTRREQRVKGVCRSTAHDTHTYELLCLYIMNGAQVLTMEHPFLDL